VESDAEDLGETPADLIEMWEAVLPPQGKVLLNERDLQLHCHCTSMQKVAAHRHAVRRRCLSIHPTRCTITLSHPSLCMHPGMPTKQLLPAILACCPCYLAFTLQRVQRKGCLALYCWQHQCAHQ
jgi:hypothetical protein